MESVATRIWAHLFIDDSNVPDRALLPQILATRSIIGATTTPLKVTGQADFSLQRSVAGEALRPISFCLVNPTASP